MATSKYKTHRVAARNLRVGTVCYHGGQISDIRPKSGTGVIVTFRDGRERYFDFPERVLIYPNL